MQMHLVGKNFEMTPALKAFTLEKLQVLEKRYRQITRVNVTFQVEPSIQIAEATLLLNGSEIHVTAKEEDLYKAIDTLIAKLLGCLTKHKEKQLDYYR